MNQASDHSLVMLSGQDQRDVGLRRAEASGYFGLGHALSDHSDLGNLLCGQELLEHCDAADVDSVLLIGFVIDPLKVRFPTMSLLPVDVVDHGEIGGIWDEGDGDDAVNEDCFASSFAKQIGLQVTQLVDARSQYFPVAVSRTSSLASAQSSKTSQASHVADFVDFFEANNSAPFLNNHSMGPSARDAHFTVVFSATQGG